MNPNSSKEIRPWMYRVPNEYLALIVSVMILTLIGFGFSFINIYLFIFLLIATLVFIRLHQAQYLGNAISVHENQFPKIYSIFHEQKEKLKIKKAHLYIVQDPYLNAFTIGYTHCTVVLTSALVEQLTLSELSFVIGHELGHYKAGHTKISTLINPLGVSNVISNFIFGFWVRKAEYSGDRCGLILTKNIDVAISALLKLAVGGKLYEQLNLAGYVEQVKISRRRLVAISEILSDHPLISNRISNLLIFWKESFVTVQ